MGFLTHNKSVAALQDIRVGVLTSNVHGSDIGTRDAHPQYCVDVWSGLTMLSRTFLPSKRDFRLNG